jgi:phage gp16-like protein
MESPPPNDAPKPDAGLPPVQPPSARFIGQLFVIPGLIILVVVVLFILSVLLVKREREPDHFLSQLDSNNLDIRWRGASDLAQILKRPEPATLRWKADTTFALDLAERLETARKQLLEDEQKIGAEIAKSTDKDRQLMWRKLRPQRDLISFLASALGEFHMPVGAPLLCTIAEHDSSADLKGNTLQRRKALWALMNMGENLKGFKKMPTEQQDAALAALREEAAKGTTARANWARTALHYLEPGAVQIRAHESIVLVDQSLVRLADSDDRFMRELVAMAFNFWDGPEAEATLLKLSRDTGRGTLIRVEETD